MSFISSILRLHKTNNPPTVDKSSDALRFGVLGAARIAPDAIVKPILSHDDAVLVAVAARDRLRAEAFAKKWRIPKTYSGAKAYQAGSLLASAQQRPTFGGSHYRSTGFAMHRNSTPYEFTELLDDPSIDAVYIPLPNALHCEWTMKALAAGKHVMCEKSIGNNEEEARKMFALAAEKNLVLLETWQPRFHPALHWMKAIVDEGSLGKIVNMESQLCLWGSSFPPDDIRYNYELGGGMLMDLGPYTINVLRYLSSAEPTVHSATTVLQSANVDRRMDAHLTFGSGDGIPARIVIDSALDGWGPFGLLPQWVKVHARVECEHGSLQIFNFPLPSLYHHITVKTKDRKTRTERVWKPSAGKGEDWWSAYRYQLEAFIDKVRGREPQAWRTPEDSISSMRTIDAIYTKTGLPLRQTKQFEI